KVTLPAATSCVVGVYVALSVDAFELNDPPPPLHVAPVADPPTEPESCTCGLAAHTMGSAPAFTVAATPMVTVIRSVAGGHGRPEAVLVKVRVTVPAAISVAEGV